MSQCQKVDRVPLSSRPVLYVTLKSEKTKGEPLHLVSAGWLGLSIFCKKWTFQCDVCGLEEKKNKTRTSKVGAISFEKCRIVPKNVKAGTLLDLLTYILLHKFKKLEGGPFEDI